MKPLTRTIHRLVELLSIVILFFFRPIIVPIIVDIVVMLIILIKDRKRESLYYDFISFIIAYILMFFTALFFPNFELLPYTPHYIYPVLLVVTVMSLIIKRPVTSGKTFKKGYNRFSIMDYIHTGVWAVTFLSATFCSFYYFPQSEYMLYSFYCLAGGIAVRIIIWTLGKFPKHAATIAK